MRSIGREHGFTIVELLIVIVVIGILAAITIISFNGISNKARFAAAQSYASQLRQKYQADAQGFWNFDECSGTTANNTGGNGSSVTTSVTGTLAWSTDTPTGTGCSVSLNGSSFIDTNIALSNTFYQKSAWIKTTSTASSMNIVSESPSGSTNSVLYISSGVASAGHNSSWQLAKGGPTINDGQWHFVSVDYTQNGSSTNGVMNLRVDGTLVATNSLAATMSTPTASLQSIGAYNSSSFFKGLMDDVMIVTHS